MNLNDLNLYCCYYYCCCCCCDSYDSAVADNKNAGVVVHVKVVAKEVAEDHLLFVKLKRNKKIN